MKNILLLSWILAVLIGCSGSEDGGVTCGEGTHDDGYGTCALDEVIAITNPGALGDQAYWQCSGIAYDLHFFSDGTGLSRDHWVLVGQSQVVEGFTWVEGDYSNQLVITSSEGEGLPFVKLNDIIPNPSYEPTSFTAVTNLGLNAQCYVMEGTLS